VLVLQGEPLVEAVMEVFNRLFPLKPKRQEAFREDFSLINATGSEVALVEVKGVSKGVSRESVNQADSHRERSGRSADFPSILIVNSNVTKASSLADKEVPVAPEQIAHAVTMNVLILRTLDLLELSAMLMNEQLTPAKVISLLTESRGWLKVGKASVELVQ
jgi:hypothetical protein